jgi:hypothetical protein
MIWCPSHRGGTYTPCCGEPKWTVTTISTIASSAAPAPASQSHGTVLHELAAPPGDGPRIATHRRYSAVGRSNGNTIVRKTRNMISSTGEHLRQID